MCGIAGIFNFNKKPVEFSEIESLTNKIAHRGKDGDGIYIESEAQFSNPCRYIALGHRRLSIIDLSESANQPMVSANGRFVIVYNGELYNFRELRETLKSNGYNFNTKSDTEIILIAFQNWGKECLKYFNGMFAFAIWDKEKRELFCARDQIGVKPFYYHFSHESFTFSSESKSIALLRNRAIKNEALLGNIFCMYQPGMSSIYDGVYKLLPGHCLTITDEGQLKTDRYWELKIKNKSVSDISFSEAQERISFLLDESVKRQLVSDVPVGLLLSGGFDSGILLAKATKNGTSLHTYSVGFDSSLHQNEVDIARSMAKRYGTIHHESIIKTSEALPLLNKAILSLSEPVADSAIVPTYWLSKMAASDGVKVLLSGTGGDEVFGGYSRYVAYSLPRRIFLTIPIFLRQILANTVLNNTILGKRMNSLRLDNIMCTGGAPELFMNFFSQKKAALSFLEEWGRNNFLNDNITLSILQRQMLCDIDLYLPDLLLMLFDQISMAHTIEGRVPYLDIDLVEESISLPPSYHISNNYTRLLQKEIGKDIIDKRTYTAKKQGFSGPFISWIDHNKRSFQDVIMTLREIDGFDQLNLEKVFSFEYQKKKRNWHNEVFSLYCLATWYNGNKK